MSDQPKPIPHPDSLRGWEKICRALGGVKAGGIEYTWDYHNEVAVKKADQTREDKRRSGRARKIKML